MKGSPRPLLYLFISISCVAPCLEAESSCSKHNLKEGVELRNRNQRMFVTSGLVTRPKRRTPSSKWNGRAYWINEEFISKLTSASTQGHPCYSNPKDLCGGTASNGPKEIPICTCIVFDEWMMKSSCLTVILRLVFACMNLFNQI